MATRNGTASKIIGSQGAALVQTDSVPSAPTIRGAYAAMPTPGKATGSIGVRFNTGAGSASAAIAKGVAQRNAQAAVGQRGLPSSVKQKMLARINRPFTAPPTPGVLADLKTDSRAAAATSAGSAQRAAALVGTKNASNLVRQIGAQFADAKASARAAAAASRAAARSGSSTSARVHAAKAKNSKIRAASLAKAMLKATADGQRAAATADGVDKASRNPSRTNIDALKKLRDTRTNFPIPPSISAAAAEDTIEGEDMLRYEPSARWSWGNTGLGAAPIGLDQIAASAEAEAAEVDRIESETYEAIDDMEDAMENISSGSGWVINGLNGLFSGVVRGVSGLAGLGATSDGTEWGKEGVDWGYAAPGSTAAQQGYIAKTPAPAGGYLATFTSLATASLQADAAKATAKANARTAAANARTAAALANQRAAQANATAQDQAAAIAANRAAAEAEAKAKAAGTKKLALIGGGGLLAVGALIAGVVAYKKWA